MTGLHGLTYVGGKLWFTAEGAKSIGRYDPQTGKVDWIMGTGQNRTHMIYVTHDEKQVYTTNVESGTVSILENKILPAPPMPPGATMPPGGPGPGGQPRTDWVQTIIPVARGSEGFDVSPDGRELWTVSGEGGAIFVIDIAAKKRTTTIDAKISGANRLQFTPDGKHVLISSLRSGDLVVYDAGTRKEMKRVAIGHGAAGILMDPNGMRAFVACTPDNYVAVIDLRTLQVTGHIDVGGGPDGLAWAVRH
jgi:YVTN family beta-propeller protein